MVNQLARQNEYFSKDRRAYSEHVGETCKLLVTKEI